MRREYVGAARKARLAAPLGGTVLDLGILGDDLSGWPAGTDPFFIVIDRGTASEEKILCESRSANSLTVFTDGVVNGRGADGTPISEHLVGAYLEHVFTATDADEANEHVNSVQDVHGVTSPVVGEDDAQTLTNKSMSGTANTFTNIPQAAVTSLVAKLGALDAEDVDLQNQIDALETGKADVASPTFTGTVTLPATTSIGNVSAAEIGYVDGATSNIQAQLNAKAPTNSPIFTGDPVLPASTTIGGVTIEEITGGGLAVPAGGNENDVLVKMSDNDYDMAWRPLSSLIFIPGNGSVSIYPDGTLTSSDHATTGTYSVGSLQYRYFRFTNTADILSIQVSNWVGDGLTGVIGQLLVVAGGGAGGAKDGQGHPAGGGGAGGLWYGEYAFGVGIHNLQVGAGGTPQPRGGTISAGNGLPSWIDQPTYPGSGGVHMLGGGGGAWNIGGSGADGGSGGGNSITGTGGAATIAGAGFAGGTGSGYPNAGGGGGAGGAGFGSSATAGGGPGLAFDITGASVTYAAGGNTGAFGAAGTNELGNGGGAGGDDGGGGAPGTGGAGGSGIIVVRYRIA